MNNAIGTNVLSTALSTESRLALSGSFGKAALSIESFGPASCFIAIGVVGVIALGMWYAGESGMLAEPVRVRSILAE